VQAFADKIDRFAQQNNRTVQFVITGGEPFIHPQIFKILQTLASVKNRTGTYIYYQWQSNFGSLRKMSAISFKFDH
jgi:organic radical activating enzyme